MSDDSSPAADLTAALRAIEHSHGRRGQVVVISDFLDRGDWAASLRRLSFAHHVLAVQIVDPREFELPRMGMLTLVDTESRRELRVQSNSRTLREQYARAAQRRHDEIAATISAARTDHLVLSTERDWLYDIVRFVSRRRLFGHADPARDRGLRAAQSRSMR